MIMVLAPHRGAKTVARKGDSDAASTEPATEETVAEASAQG
jgi:hypothetical protein